MRIGYGRSPPATNTQKANRAPSAPPAATRPTWTRPTATWPADPNWTSAFIAAGRPGDQLAVTKLDRLGRSLDHLLDLSQDLQERGVDLVVLDQGIDTSTAVGRMFFQILGAIAEFEHALMSERTRDGLAAARARGRTGGQKPKLGAVRRGWPRPCRTSSTSTAGIATPSLRSRPSSESPGRPSTATWTPSKPSRKGIPLRRSGDLEARRRSGRFPSPQRVPGTGWRPNWPPSEFNWHGPGNDQVGMIDRCQLVEVNRTGPH